MSNKSKIFLYLAWLQALLAALMSLFFSEILLLPPCTLCWYQRVFMYPLVFIIAAGILKKDKNIYFYTLPIPAVGWLISLYQNLLYFHIISEKNAPCTAGVSCTAHFFNFLGFIDIPQLSLIAFSIILICLIASYRYNKEQ